MNAASKPTTLGELKRGERARIVSVGRDGEDPEMARRLMEMGLIDGSSVELVHEAPFGGDPIAVRVRGALVALRRAEANQVEVERT
ncbi:MAG: FeoA family protein [Bdellovibrionota bacterium]